ncbi:hypothetical protein WJX74_000280 [Apatococcus lobatus]|uniref:CCD97-like C-terminal domain-containing protein n=2 Tax=Apatococcus TaxID=904362 RepID=A0AAW1SS56_9CHLO
MPACLEKAASVVARLSQTDLKLPASVTASTKDDTEEGCKDKKSLYLSSLLQKDPAIFLERHGGLLSEKERQELFRPCADDYEVAYHLERLSPQGAAIRVKNRRLAQMNRMLKEQETPGSYFSETSMRRRAPLLYQQYTDNKQPHTPAAASNKLSEILLARHDEMATRQRLSEQEHAENLIEVEESESEEDEAVVSKPGHAPAPAPSSGTATPPVGGPNTGQAEISDLLEVMKMRFLAGQDADVTDYRSIDANEALDDDWLQVARQDAEDRYFDSE